MAVVLVVDAGTTGVRSMAVDESGRVVGSRYREFPQYFPRPGWVEHDAEEIWQAVAATLAELVGALDRPVAALGLSVQRETTVVWDRRDGRPLHKAVVWQDRRTAPACEQLEQAGHLPLIRARTGLVLDPYFSATKLAWILGPGGVEAGPDTAFGTVDSWLVWRLSGGRAHVTDPSNASRTMLFDITRLAWDDELAALLKVPTSLLPEVGPSSGRLAETGAGVVPGLPGGLPISGVAGDQQAALFGQACFEPGMAKNTYGTGSFVLMNVGDAPPAPADGLLTSVAWSLGEVTRHHTSYSLEGSVFVTGAAVQWLRDGLGIISESAEIGPLAASVPDAGGACFVPALTGLGSPWWDPYARGTLVGLTRGVGRAQLARAAVEAMAFQTADVVATMRRAGPSDLPELRIDGGASVMDLLVQIQADVLGIPVRRNAVADTTALGAAFLAGLAEGVWGSLDDIAGLWTASLTAVPADDRAAVEAAYAGWARAVERARSWA
jgi:glycerol kinase